jgi:hypothetical protein
MKYQRHTAKKASLVALHDVSRSVLEGETVHALVNLYDTRATKITWNSAPLKGISLHAKEILICKKKKCC